jgi:chromosome segregation ATPase
MAMERREIVEDIIRLVESDAALAERLRRALLSRELLELPEHVAALVGAMHDMATTQRAILEAVHALSQSIHSAVEGLRTLMQGHERLQQDMAILKEDVAVLKEDVAVLKEDVAVLKEDVAILKEDVAILKEDVAILKEDVAVLKEDVAILKQDVATLKEGQARLEKRVARLEADVADLRGDSLERRYRERAPGYFSPLVRRIRVIAHEELAHLLEEAQEQGLVSEQEVDDALAVDVVARGRSRQTDKDIVIVAEVSAAIYPEDVRRALSRAQVIGRALRLEAIPVVAGLRITPAAEALARGQAWRLLDGRPYPPGTAAPTYQEEA